MLGNLENKKQIEAIKLIVCSDCGLPITENVTRCPYCATVVRKKASGR